jgi:hypothetical protein
LPPGRSAIPTLDEWNKMQKEVTVKGSSALACETKIVREYLRVSCKKPVEFEGTPKGIKVLRGGHEAMVFAHDGVMSLIVPFVEGTDFEAVFSWSKKSHKLAVKWPKGNARPAIVGTFEGAASPLDIPPDGTSAKLCACWRRSTGAADCSEIRGGGHVDCDLTYGNDCPKLLSCSTGDGSALPRCRPGYVLMGAFCYKTCRSDSDCPDPSACSNYGSVSVCRD